MDGILSTIGLCSIVLFIFYIIKKVDDYLYFKKDGNKNINFDKE